MLATGGLVDTGKPVAMPQGHKKPSSPVSINRLSGTFKKGGKVHYKNDGGEMDSKAARETKGYEGHYAREAAENRAVSEAMNPMTYIRPLVDKVRGAFASKAPAGSITKTEKSVTITPKGQRKGGKVMC